MKLSIIILNYNTKDLLRACLSSVKASTDKLKKEIIVVDNASKDSSVAMIKQSFPQVKLIQADANNGYAAGNNLGLKVAKGELILLLNSDTKINKSTLQTMVEFMDNHPKVGVSTCKVVLKNGRPDPAAHRGFPTPWASLTYFLNLEKLFPKTRLFGSYHQGWKDMTKAHQIDSPAGAFYLTRSQVLDQVGLLDERYFIYAEDLDLSLRIKKKHWLIMFVPTTSIIHYKKSSGRQAVSLKLRKQTSAHFFATMKLFYDKHYAQKYSPILRWLTLTGIWLISKLRH